MDALEQLLLKNANSIAIKCIESVHNSAIEVKFGFRPSKDVLEPIERLISAGGVRAPQSSEQFIRLGINKLILMPLEVGGALSSVYLKQGFEVRLDSETYDEQGNVSRKELKVE